MTTTTHTTRPSDNARRATWVSYVNAVHPDIVVSDDDTKADLIALVDRLSAHVPSGVIVRDDIDPADVIGTHRPRYIDPADMVVVSASWGTNATLDVAEPHRGVGRGYVRPFIRNGDGDANNHGFDADTGTMTCRNGDACVDPIGPTMPVTRFPTLSRPTADGRTRADRCRRCRDAR